MKNSIHYAYIVTHDYKNNKFDAWVSSRSFFGRVSYTYLGSSDTVEGAWRIVGEYDCGD